jgi:ABC-2 type transport system permease protein
VKVILPPPFSAPPPGRSPARDFVLLLKNEIRVTWNTVRQRPVKTIAGVLVLLLLALSLLGSLGYYAYGALKSMPPQIVQGFLSLLFMAGLTGQIFFGVTTAFVSLYMSDDLELLFMAPIPFKVVFAVKSLSVLASNLLVAFLFAFLPGVFAGLFFRAPAGFYFLVLLVSCGLLLTGTAVAELINLLVMRLVPPHRSKEAVGFIGALTGILIALVSQLPGMLLGGEGKTDLNAWLGGQSKLLQVMDFFPWGWGSTALVRGLTGSYLAGLGWSLLVILTGIVLFGLAFVLVERGFRRGFISLSQGEGGRRRKTRPGAAKPAAQAPSPAMTSYLMPKAETLTQASPWAGAWAVARKDWLAFKRDTREWFTFLMPLILMAFFIGRYFVSPSVSNSSSLITVLVIYTLMFSGNMALRSFGKEGESDWILNTVPLAGWPVVWGKLAAAVLPTLILMEVLVIGSAVALHLAINLILVIAPAVLFLSLGSSAIGLYYSINYCRYNPDKPQMRISPGASLVMYLINLLFLLFLGLGVGYLFPPAELVSLLRGIPPVTFHGGFLSVVLYGLYHAALPMLWPPLGRIVLGLLLTLGGWSLIFFGFMAATVRQSKKGFRVELVTGSGRKK